jgi:hypothetical protein
LQPSGFLAGQIGATQYSLLTGAVRKRFLMVIASASSDQLTLAYLFEVTVLHRKHGR